MVFQAEGHPKHPSSKNLGRKDPEFPLDLAVQTLMFTSSRALATSCLSLRRERLSELQAGPNQLLTSRKTPQSNTCAVRDGWWTEVEDIEGVTEASSTSSQGQNPVKGSYCSKALGGGGNNKVIEDMKFQAPHPRLCCPCLGNKRMGSGSFSRVHGKDASRGHGGFRRVCPFAPRKPGHV